MLILENPEGTDQERRLVQYLGDQCRLRNPTDCSRRHSIRSGTSIRKAVSTGVWDNSLAADKPQYNADFTEMTAQLRKGIFWSDGVEFTADDVISTVMTQIKNPGCGSARFWPAMSHSVDAPDPYTVVFKLKKPNSRFHANFTVRWNAIWIMPKHVFEKVEDPAKFDFNKPVSLGAYVLQQLRPRRQMVHLAIARRLAAHHARRVTASPVRNISPMSIPARRTSG